MTELSTLPDILGIWQKVRALSGAACLRTVKLSIFGLGQTLQVESWLSHANLRAGYRAPWQHGDGYVCAAFSSSL